jgi:hypothetical protein
LNTVLALKKRKLAFCLTTTLFIYGGAINSEDSCIRRLYYRNPIRWQSDPGIGLHLDRLECTTST